MRLPVDDSEFSYNVQVHTGKKHKVDILHFASFVVTFLFSYVTRSTLYVIIVGSHMVNVGLDDATVYTHISADFVCVCKIKWGDLFYVKQLFQFECHALYSKIIC